MRLIVTFSQLYLKFNNLFVQCYFYKNNFLFYQRDIGYVHYNVHSI